MQWSMSFDTLTFIIQEPKVENVVVIAPWVRPRERNPIESKFGHKRWVWSWKIRAKLASTSESWISTIILVLNLAKLAGTVQNCLTHSFVKHSESWYTIQVNQLLLSLSVVLPKIHRVSGWTLDIFSRP